MGRRASIRKHLTDSACSEFPPGPKRYRVAVEGAPGLKLVVDPSGRRWWSYRYRTREGRESEQALGVWPAVNVKQARTLALKAEAAKAEGRDPIEERRTKRAEAIEARSAQKAEDAQTFDLVASAYMEASKAGLIGKKGKKAASTIEKEGHYLRKELRPRLGSRPINSIKRVDLVPILEDIHRKSGHGAANSSLEVLQRVFAYGHHCGALDEDRRSPTSGLSRFASSPRDVILTNDQMRDLWVILEEAKQEQTLKDGTEKAGETYFTAAALQIETLTLQRRGEVATMRKADIDLDALTWIIPAMNKKERRKGLTPLSPWAAKIIKEAMALSSGEWVFPGRDPSGHLQPRTITRFLARIRDKERLTREAAKKRTAMGKPQEGDAELLARRPVLSSADGKNITPHDLRRTGRTLLTVSNGAQKGPPLGV